MRCPVDDTDLLMTDRNGIEVDYCPKCRGVWLDRGELDKVIERSSASNTAAPSPHYGREEFDDEDHRREYRDREHYEERHRDEHRGPDPRHHKKKESFLGDLFDF
ncbi:MAG TPA: zf-TFIIB domain-containing protein [Candidatus Saccharimonadales bacterium]|nr:zf-TFIIB domain-containing protein [Candidatus Saccharimonadales bacterium]